VKLKSYKEDVAKDIAPPAYNRRKKDAFFFYTLEKLNEVHQKSKFILDSTWNMMSAEARLKYQVCLAFAFVFAASSALCRFLCLCRFIRLCFRSLPLPLYLPREFEYLCLCLCRYLDNGRRLQPFLRR
jgi:hypothetical protein